MARAALASRCQGSRYARSVLYAALAHTSQQLVETSSRKKKIEQLARLFVDTAADEHAIVARHLSGEVGH